MHTPVTAPEGVKSETPQKKKNSSTFYPQSVWQLIGVAIFMLAGAWVIYHLSTRTQYETRGGLNWSRQRPTANEPRLTVTKPVQSVQKVRVLAKETVWIRVRDSSKMLFEGLLHAGNSKEWSGQGPYQVKISRIAHLDVFWNDQPVDISVGAQGQVNTIQLPPAK
jgi:hypothetical protein